MHTPTTLALAFTKEQLQHIVLALLPPNLSGTSSNSPWYIDYEASNHMTGQSSFLHDTSPYLHTQLISIAGGEKHPISKVGSILFASLPSHRFTLNNVFHFQF